MLRGRYRDRDTLRGRALPLRYGGLARHYHGTATALPPP